MRKAVSGWISSSRSGRTRTRPAPRARGSRLTRWIAPLAGAAVLAMMAGVQGVDAQENRWGVDARGGVAIPAGNLSDILDPGGTAGVGISYALNEWLAVRADGDVAFLQGDDAPDGGSLPNMDVWHYGAGLEALLAAPCSPWNLAISLGVGGTTMDSKSFRRLVLNPATGFRQVSFRKTYFTANGGVKGGVDVSDRLRVFAGAQAFLIFTDDDQTAVFHGLTPEVDPTGFSTALNIPFHAGLQVRF